MLPPSERAGSRAGMTASLVHLGMDPLQELKLLCIA